MRFTCRMFVGMCLDMAMPMPMVLRAPLRSSRTIRKCLCAAGAL